MIPNFNPNKWDKQKIIDYVIGDAPLTDQQLEFLNYFEKLQHRLEEEIECKEIAQGHEENLQVNEAYERKEKQKWENAILEYERYLQERIKIAEQDDTYVSGMHFIGQNHAVLNNCYEKLQECKEKQGIQKTKTVEF